MSKIRNLILLLTIVFQSCNSSESSYFDQETPSTVPQLFAAGTVNTQSIELNVVFNNDFTEMLFSRIVDGSFVIFHSEKLDGQWTTAEAIPMYPENVALSVACDPTLSADGKTMYFLGVDPENYEQDISLEQFYRIPPDIYMSKKVNGKWQPATKVAAPVSTAHFESYPIVVGDGSLYFQSDRPGGAGGRDTYRAQYLSEGNYENPVSISINSEQNASSTYISPNEDYLIASSREGFQLSLKKDGQWQPSKTIPLPYEEGWVYYCPYMSPDGKYFFFSRRYYGSDKRGWAGVTEGEVYWVDARVIFK